MLLEGYIFWEGRWKTSLCQFRDNILLASNAAPQDCQDIVTLVKWVLEKV